MSIKKDLISNSKEYFQNALNAQKKRQYNTSVTLFFKTLSTLSDLFILIQEGKIPSSHSERFRILKEKYPLFYNILDKDFPFYQQSYRSKLNFEISKMFENDCREFFKRIKF